MKNKKIIIINKVTLFNEREELILIRIYLWIYKEIAFSLDKTWYLGLYTALITILCCEESLIYNKFTELEAACH